MFYALSIREFMEFSCFTLPKYLKTYIVCSKRSFPWSFFCWFSPFFVFDVVILGMCFWSKWCRFCFQYNAKKVLRKRKHFRKWDCRRKRLFCGVFFPSAYECFGCRCCCCFVCHRKFMVLFVNSYDHVWYRSICMCTWWKFIFE